MNGLLQDLRFGLRSLRKNVALTVVAVVSLGMGIGANTMVFTWMNAFVLQPLPAAPRSSELVHVNTHGPNDANWSLSYLSLRDWRAATQSMELAGASFIQLGLKDEGGGVERAWGGLVSGNYFDMLQLRPALGRLLTPRDEAERAPVVVLGYSYWRRRFAADTAIVGRRLTLNGVELSVVGVAPPRFGGTVIGLQWDLFVPVTDQPLLIGYNGLEHRDNQWLDGTGRLRAGWTLERARAELDQVARRVATETGDGDSRNGAFVRPIASEGAASFLKPVFYALLGITGVVLLIACANVANLLLARAVARRREIGVRLALGASRGRLVRQLLTESVALGALAGLVGIVISLWSRDLFASFIPPSPFPVVLDIRVDGRVLLFAFAVTMATALVFGLVPALQASNPDLVSTLKDGIGGTPTRRARLQSALVVTQVALSLVSLVCAGLFIRSLDASRRADLGFEAPEQALLVSTDLKLAGVPDSARPAMVRSLLAQVRTIPGVVAASLTSGSPLGFGGNSSWGVQPEGYVPRPNENMAIRYYAVGDDYFRAMAVPIVRGRGFDASDMAERHDVVIVNEQFVTRFWPGLDPIGRRLTRDGTLLTVVGVAKQGRYDDITGPKNSFLYVPWSQQQVQSFDVIVRAAGDPRALTAQLRRTFQATDAGLPFLDVRTMSEHIQAALTTQTLGATMLAGFGIMALLLSAIGIYGVLSYSVSQRTREIGLRLALGAARTGVVGLVVGRAMRLAGLGLAVGLLAAVGAGQLLRTQLVDLLYQVQPGDPSVFGAVIVGLLGVAAIAAWLPARRAARVDPMIALRSE